MKSLGIFIQEDTPDWEYEVRKWRYNILKKLLDKKYSNEDLLQKIEEVYADFYYPDDMRNFIYYIPSGTFDPTKFSVEECRNRLVDIFYEFLKKEHRFLSMMH